MLRQADTVRRGHRDAVAAELRRLGGTPPAPLPAYALIGSVDSTAAALSTARRYSDTLQARALEGIQQLADRPAREVLGRLLVEEATYRTRLDVTVVGDVATRPSVAVRAFPGRRP